MVRVTGNFQSESPLHPKAFEVLHAAFENGWANPSKLSESSVKANLLRNEAMESIATSLGESFESIHPFSSPSLGYFLGIQGLRQNSETLIFGSTDRKDVYAIASTCPNQIMESGLDGKLILPSKITAEGVLALQIANAETGVIQECEEIMRSVNASRIFLDSTTSGLRLPINFEYSTAIFDSRSWYGPAEVGFLVVKKPIQWSNPLPHLNAARTNFDASLPLLLASAVALENFAIQVKEEDEQIRSFNSQMRDAFSQIPNSDIAGLLESSLPHLLSVSFLNCNGEELLRAISSQGFSVDSGSACTADNLEPSHVLAAMGVLTHGNIRITIHPGTTQQEVDGLISTVATSVEKLRS